MANQYEHSEAYKKALQALNTAGDSIKEALSAPELNTLCTTVMSNINKSANLLRGLSGTTDFTEVNSAAAFGPVTKFMGQEINRALPISKDDLTPKEMEKIVFLAARNTLYEAFPELDNDSILMRLKQPQGEAVIRSTAKKAGLFNYKDAEINVLYLDEIRERIVAKNSIEETVERVQKKSTVPKRNAKQ